MFEELGALVRREQAWLTERITALARRHGFALEGPELLAGWEASVCGFLEPIDRAVAEPALLSRLDADTDYADHPLTAYGIAAARSHRGRGVSLTAFLALMKYYRRAHVALLERAGITGDKREAFHDFLDGVFDLVEIGVVTEWSSRDHDARLDELRRANRAAVAERLKYLTVFESVASPIVMLDGEDRIENANWAAMRTFASAPTVDAESPGGGYYGGRLPRLLADRVGELLAAAAEGRPAALDTVRGERHFRVTARPLLAVTGERPGRVVLLADVTDYVSELAEARLVNRAKSAFIATMSHEIRTPLTGILGAAELMALEEARHRGDEGATLTAIRASARVLLNLVDDVLDHARLEAGTIPQRPVRVHLEGLLDAAVATIAPRARSKGLALATAIDATVDRTVEVDAAKLQRIVVNLLDNAVKFTERGEVRLEAGCDSEELSVAVVDTGRGFDAPRLDRLFEPYVQDPARGDDTLAGTGLGLAICRRLADVLGGTLAATSAPAAGTRFVLRVPVASVAAAPDPPRAGAADGAGAQVLVVEDDEVNRMVTAGLLAHAGFAVTAVATAAEAAPRAARRDSSTPT
ncbi:MAG: ATP-binding protein, partial [Alphaproteobacteria bacterium]